MHDGSNTTSVATSSDHAQVSSLEFDGIHDFASVDVQPKKLWGKNSLIRKHALKLEWVATCNANSYLAQINHRKRLPAPPSAPVQSL